MNDSYRVIYDIVVNQCDVDPQEKLVSNGYYLTVYDYMVAVSERGGAFRIIPTLKSMNQQSIRAYLWGAADRIIAETLSGNKDYSKYYKKKLKGYRQENADLQR